MPDYNKYHNGQTPNGFNGFSYSPENKHEKLNNDELDLKQLFYTLWSRKWIIIGTTLACAVIAGLIAFLSTPIYRSEGSMLIEESASKNPFGGSGSEGIGQLLSSTYGLGMGSTLDNEMQILQSRKLSNSIADTLIEERLMPNGRQFPVLFKGYPEDSTIINKDTVATRIRNHIVFSKADREADVVNVTYESPSPYESAHIVNLSMKLYKDLSTQDNRASASSAVSFLKKEQSRIKKDLQSAEAKLRHFMNDSKLVEVDAQTKELISRMADLQAKKQEARAKLVAANSAIEQYHSKLNSIKPGLAEQYSEAVGPNITKLQYAKSELELKKTQLLANNPELNDSSPQIQKLDRQIASYKNRITQLTQSLIDKNDQYLSFLGSGGESGVAQTVSEINQKMIEAQVEKKQFESQIKVINSQLSDQENFFNNLPDNMIKLAKLKRDVEINEKLYVTVSQQYAETALWKQTQFGLGRIIDNGYIPKEPVKPNKIIYILVGFLFGGIFSVGFVLVKEAFNTKIDGVEKMRSLKEPLLAVIPTMEPNIRDNYDGAESVDIKGKNVSSGLITVLDSISPITESFRRLQNNLIYSNPDANLNSIMVTSSGKGEGKTTTISNLGVVLAEAGYNTLIVDTDFRRPNLHNLFGSSKKPGFMEVLFDDINLEDGIHETLVSNLSILPTGRRPPNASAITQSKAFLTLLKKLEGMFDFVLIDTPPFGIITDATAMLQQTDAVVVISRFEETSEIQITQTLEQLHRLRANIIGTVLTAFDYKESKDYYLSSSYYKGVYKDYGSYHDKEEYTP